MTFRRFGVPIVASAHDFLSFELVIFLVMQAMLTRRQQKGTTTPLPCSSSSSAALASVLPTGGLAPEDGCDRAQSALP